MRKNQWRAFAGIASLSLCLGLGAAVMPMNVRAAQTEWSWETVKDNRTFVSLTPGTDETELNFAWYSEGSNDAQVRFGTKETLTNKNRVIGESTDIDGTKNTDVNDTYYSNKVTVTGLKENTTYYYQVKKNGTWQEVETYQTHSFSDFSFLYVGDPQIGASGNAQNDATSWNDVLNTALDKFSDVSFMVSAGDQINNTNGDSEEEYSGYLSVNALTSLPVATTIGNHDAKNPNYSYHFNNPNNQDDEMDSYTAGRTAAGTDYYYKYGNVLFIMIDTNNYNCATHENVIKKAVSDYPDAKWRVVTFHQDIYGTARNHSDSDGMVLRTQLTPIMDEYDIDVVLQGHDHTYSRTYQLSGDGKEHKAYSGSSSAENYYRNDPDYQNENLCYVLESDVVGGTVTNPEGTVYYEANSATGSKYYDLRAETQDYIAEKSQTETPTYSVVRVTDDSFSVTTYNANDESQLEGSSTYTIVKTDETDNQNKPQPVPEENDTSVNNGNTNTGDSSNAGNQQTVTEEATAPAKVKGVKVKRKSAKKVSVKWKKEASADGYQIQYSYKKGFRKNVKKITINKVGKTSKVLKKMKTGKKLFVRVRAYKNVNGQKIYGSFSKVKKITVR